MGILRSSAHPARIGAMPSWHDGMWQTWLITHDFLPHLAGMKINKNCWAQRTPSVLQTGNVTLGGFRARLITHDILSRLGCIRNFHTHTDLQTNTHTGHTFFTETGIAPLNFCRAHPSQSLITHQKLIKTRKQYRNSPSVMGIAPWDVAEQGSSRLKLFFIWASKSGVGARLLLPGRRSFSRKDWRP